MKIRDYGVGIEWAQKLQEEALKALNQFSCFEIIPENFITTRFKDNAKVQDNRNLFLHELRKVNMPVILHGVELSIGTDAPLKQAHLNEILRVKDSVNTVLLTEHLCMTEAGGMDIGQLTTLPWTNKVCDVVSRKVEKVMAQIDVPFALENITNRFEYPGNDLSETAFINKIMDRTGCKLLLDLNNVYTNSVNHGFDPTEWLEEINLDHVSMIHLAGGVYDDEGDLLDSHSNWVCDNVWNLYRWICRRSGPITTIIERTDEVPPIADLLLEVELARAISKDPKNDDLLLNQAKVIS